MEKLVKIGELVKLSGVQAGMIRYFEKHRVISPARRTPVGYRLFRQEHVEELRFVLNMQRLGFYCQHIRALREIARSHLARAEKAERVRRLFEEHRAHVSERVRYFTRLETELQEAAPGFVDEVLRDQ